MNKIKNTKELFSKGVSEVKNLLKNTALEVYLLAGIGGIIGGGITLNNEIKNSKQIPLAFSEISQIEQNAKKAGVQVGPITEYNLRVNDLCMKIFEANNEANNFDFNRDQRFYSNIYDCLNLRNIYKYNLSDLLNTATTYIPDVEKELEKYFFVGKSLKTINQNMDDSWDDSHVDIYRPEIRTRTVTDSIGNTHTETYTEMVYDHTIHSYDYDKSAGEAGSKNLEAMFSQIPELHINEKILTADKTNAEGEYAAEKSRKSKSDKKLNEEDFVKIANIWFSGSTILNNSERINKNYPLLNSQSLEWKVAKNYAHDETYNTNSHYDSGPREFQVAENVLETGQEIKRDIDEIFYSLENTNKNIPMLKQTLDRLVEEGYIKNKKSAKKLKKEVMNLTKEIYKQNFKNGVDVDQFNYLAIVFGLMIGAIGGGLIGGGVDYLTNKYKLYDYKLKK